MNKTDLNQHHLNHHDPLLNKFKAFPISAKTGDGISQIKHALHQDFVKKTDLISGDFICNIRQINCLKQVHQHILDCQHHMALHYEYDLLSIDIKQAILKLGELTGDDVTEEVLDGIFSRFCVGK